MTLTETQSPPRIAIVHIGKTGGISLTSALRTHYASELVCPLQFEGQYPNNLNEVAAYKLFDSHFGFALASQLDAKLVTVMRNPFDRLVSIYHYWREVPQTEGGPGFAKQVSFEEFLAKGPSIPFVAVDVCNAQTWQIARGMTAASRAGTSESDILKIAKENLESFDAVGVTEALPVFAADVEKNIGLSIDLSRKLNVTKSRPTIAEISPRLRDMIYPLVSIDLALYEHVLKRFVFPHSQ